MGDITTSWPSLAAATPPAVPRQLITAAVGERPPSRISSQPIRRRPLAASIFSTRRLNQLCSSASFLRPSTWIRFWQSRQACQRVLGASSPPMCTNSEGNMAMTSSSTSWRKINVSSLPAQRISSVIPGPLKNGKIPNGPPVQDNCGSALSAARLWPGISISGTIVMCRRAA